MLYLIKSGFPPISRRQPQVQDSQSQMLLKYRSTDTGQKWYPLPRLIYIHINTQTLYQDPNDAKKTCRLISRVPIDNVYFMSVFIFTIPGHWSLVSHDMCKTNCVVINRDEINVFSWWTTQIRNILWWRARKFVSTSECGHTINSRSVSTPQPHSLSRWRSLRERQHSPLTVTHKAILSKAAAALPGG